MASTALDPNKIRAYTDFGAKVVSEAVCDLERREIDEMKTKSNPHSYLLINI